MNFKNIPSWAEEYDFIVCYKNEEENCWEYWSVESREIGVKTQCNLIRSKGLKPLVVEVLDF